MSFEIKGIENIDLMRKAYDNILRDTAKKIMADIMLEVVRLTNLGINAYGKPFLPYASSTVKKKAKQGKSTTPNMQDTSSMISSLSFVKSKTKKGFASQAIGVRGSYKGISNRKKLRHLKDMKNYVILEWTPYYDKIVKKHLKVMNEKVGRLFV